MTTGKKDTGTTMSESGIDVESLDVREIPHPQHPWDVAKRCIQKACGASEHEWVELTGAPNAYWRECRVCRIADVTAKAFGQNVETPNADQREGYDGW